MIEHKMILEAFDGDKWDEIHSFAVTNRYKLTRHQRIEINALKYECELAGLEWRIVKERRMLR